MRYLKALKNELYESFLTKQGIIKILIVVCGAFLSGFALNSFISPHQILAGGLTGIATLFYFATGIPNYIYLWLINIPLFIFTFRYTTRNFTILSVISFTVYALSLQHTKGVFFPISNPIVSSIFGGILIGTGTALVFSQGGSLGGMDTMYIYFKEKHSKSISKANLIINICILIILIMISGFECAALTTITMYFVSKAVTTILNKIKHKKTILVISEHWRDISADLLAETKLGVTFLNGQGAYSNSDKNVIFFVTKNSDLAKVKELILKKDPGAFITIIDTHDVHGGGFSTNAYIPMV